MATQHTAPSQVQLLYCSIKSPGIEHRMFAGGPAAEIVRNGINLAQYLQEFSIYENIFDNTISAHVTLLEDVGLIEFIPIVGVEVLWLGFRVIDGKGEEQTFSRAFRVTRVRDVSYPRHGFRLYTLDLATHEFVTSLSSRICRNFEEKRCDEAVRLIMEKDMGIDPARIVEIEPTYGTMNATLPNYTPLQAVNYFTMLAQTTKTPRESNFLFYETLTGFYFRSIRSMILAGKTGVIPTFKFDPGAVTGGPVVDETARNVLHQMHQEQTCDLTTDIVGGMLRSKMVHFDFLARKVAHTEDSRYTETFKNTTHLSAYPVYPNNFDLAVSKNTRIFTFPSNYWSANSAYLNQIERRPVQNMWESIVLRERQLREIQHLQTLIDIPGHPELRAGGVVNVQYLPSHVLQNGGNRSTNESVKGEPTPYHSGPHLIVGLKHRLRMRSGSGEMEYRMHMRVCRDSLSSPLIGTSSTEGL